MFDADPVLHPEDRPDAADEAGPWLAILAAATVGWVALAVVDWRLLSGGTFLWATVRSVYVLLLAPLAAAALLQDTRVLALDDVDFGRLKWLYAGVALVFPPVAALYLAHRHVRVSGDPPTAE